MAAKVTSADTNDREGLKYLLDKIKDNYQRLKVIFADMGYLGQKTAQMVKKYARELKIVKRPRKWYWVPEEVKDMNAYLEEKGVDTSTEFKVLPKRWIVERTFAWLNKYRRLSKDYEYLLATSESTLLLAMSRILLNRLARLAV